MKGDGFGLSLVTNVRKFWEKKIKKEHLPHTFLEPGHFLIKLRQILKGEVVFQNVTKY